MMGFPSDSARLRSWRQLLLCRYLGVMQQTTHADVLILRWICRPRDSEAGSGLKAGAA